MVIGAFVQKWTKIDDKCLPLICWLLGCSDRVRDPGNLWHDSALLMPLRTGIILIDDCTDPYSVEAVRASMGAVFNVCLARATAAEFSNFCQIWQGSVIGTACQLQSIMGRQTGLAAGTINGQ